MAHLNTVHSHRLLNIFTFLDTFALWSFFRNCQAFKQFLDQTWHMGEDEKYTKIVMKISWFRVSILEFIFLFDD